MPMRVPTVIAGSRQAPVRAPIRTGPRASEVPLSCRRMPSACVSLPGPEQSSESRTGCSPIDPRRSRIRSSPAVGASARISTPAPTPAGSQTAFSIA